MKLSKDINSIKQFISKLAIMLTILLLISRSNAYAQVPVAQFTANIVSGCAPLGVQFTDQSTNNPTFWNWDLGNGQLSTAQNPVGIYSTPGTYTITLVVRNSNGTASITKTNYIVANPSPVADFSTDKTIACQPAVIKFTDKSTPGAGSIASYAWDFGDGNTSNQASPTHSYTNLGFYNVNLTVTSTTGCSNSIGRYNYIRVVSGVTADFIVPPSTSCKAPFPVTLSNQTSGPGSITYNWDLGNATTSTAFNPSTVYATAGTYTIKLTATSEYGCSATVQKTTTISPITTAINSPDTACLNSYVSFQNSSSATPVSSIWNFGNGSSSFNLNDSSLYSTAGTYTVKLVNQYASCADSITKNLVILAPPTINFSTLDTAACKAPLTVNFTDATVGAAAWNWNFGDGGTAVVKNPSHIYAANGNYNVTLTVTTSKGCSNTLTKPAYIKIQKPIVGIKNINVGGCVPFLYAPLDTVQTVDPVISYLWDFGDGFTSTVKTPSHNYTTTGKFTVKLYITTKGGCTDSVVYVNGVKVGTPTTANFSVSVPSSCAKDSVSFTDLSGTADEWLWDFGDGSTSALQNPKHLFQDTGYFSVSLVAINQGCSTAVTKANVVQILPPVARFNFNVDCTNKTLVSFADASKASTAYGPITYAWNFGDPGNNTSTLNNPTFNYPALGTYQVTLTVTNGSCTSSIKKVVRLVAEVADFTVSKTLICKNESININTTANIANIAKFEWYFDGGPAEPAPGNISRTFTTVGPHTIKLVITTVSGCKDSITKVNVVTVEGPTAAFSIGSTPPCKGAAINFTDNSSGTLPIVQWKWVWGDGNTQTYTAPPFSHSYADTGRYQVKLIITDNLGCKDSITKGPQFVTAPVANFGSKYLKICPATPMQFTDSSRGYGLTYNWNFGDGGSSTVKNPSYQYAGPDATYSVKLVITDSLGCKDSITKTNYINVIKPKPALSVVNASSFCPPLETKFTFLGQDYESFYWNFGDGTSSNLANPNHFYNAYGSFNARLVLVGYGGCLDSASTPVNVYNASTATDIQITPTQSCNTLLANFTITAPANAIAKLYFGSGDGYIDSSGTKSFTYLYKTIGTYAPYLQIKDSSGCIAFRNANTTVKVLGALPFFGVDKKEFCDVGTVNFGNFTIKNDPITSSVWDFGDGNTSTATNPTHTYVAPGRYIVSLNVSTQAGCNSSTTDTINVYATPKPAINGDSILCINETGQLLVSLPTPDPNATYLWNLGGTNTSTIINPTVKYAAAGTYSVSVKATNKLGCIGNATKSIKVTPNPTITFNGPITLPIGTTVQMPVSYSGPMASYTWSPDTNITCTNCAIPSIIAKRKITYTVSVVDSNGCTATGSILVNALCNEKNYFVPNTFSPNGDGVNDVFYPRGVGLARVQVLRIFNRWGQMVFERKDFDANDASKGWNGTINGIKADIDTYVYYVEFVCENAAILPYKGNVTLIR